MKLRNYSTEIADRICDYLSTKTSRPFFDERYGLFRFSVDSEFLHSISYSILVLENRFVVFAFYPEALISFPSWMEEYGQKPETSSVNPSDDIGSGIRAERGEYAIDRWKSELMKFLHYCFYYYGFSFQMDEFFRNCFSIRYRVSVDCTGIIPSDGMIENSLIEPLTALEKVGPGINSFCRDRFSSKDALFHCKSLWKMTGFPRIQGTLDEEIPLVEDYRLLCTCEGIGSCGQPQYVFDDE